MTRWQMFWWAYLRLRDYGYGFGWSWGRAWRFAWGARVYRMTRQIEREFDRTA